MLTISIFISSPGDVATERVRSERVIRKLEVEFSGKIRLKPYYWEHEPMRATAPFNDPSNIPLTSSFDIVVCILWARLGTPLQIKGPDGIPYPSGTVFELETARASYAANGAPDLLVYQRKQDVAMPHDEKLREERERQWRALNQFIREWFFSEENAYKAALNNYKLVSEFEGLLENHLRRLIEEILVKHGDSPEPTDDPGVEAFHGGNPFLGLEPFQFKDRNLFFGRSQMIEDLLSSLRNQAEQGWPAVILHGMSGSGKSSLVRAGVLPLLMRPGVIENIAGWRRAEFRPAKVAANPFLGLAESLFSRNLSLVAPPDSPATTTAPGETFKIDLDMLPALPELGRLGLTPESLAELLEKDPEKVPPLIERALGLVATDLMDSEGLRAVPVCRLILMIDQLEELFSDEVHFPPAVRERFDIAVATMVRSGVVWCLMTLRSDYLVKIAELPKILEITAKGGQMLLAPPSVADLSMMIRLPARAAGVVFEQNAANLRLEDRLLEEARNAPDGLPLLGFVLQELYQRMPAGRKKLTHAALDEMNGLEGAVAACAENVFQKYLASREAESTERSSEALRAIVRALATLPEEPDAPPLRRIAPMAPLEKIPAAKDLVDRLVKARLLAVGSGENSAATVQVTHEALFRKWPRLKEAIGNDRKFLRCRRRADAAANQWKSRDCGKEFLWDRGALLDEAKYLLGYDETLDPATLDFCKASIAGASKRSLRTTVTVAIALLVVAAIPVAFFVRPKPKPAELSRHQLEEIERVKKAGDIASLEEQLDNVMRSLDSASWQEAGTLSNDAGEDEEEEEGGDGEPARFPELEVSELSRRLREVDPDNKKAFAAGVRADIAVAPNAEDPERLYDDIESRLKQWTAKGQPENDLLDLQAQIAWNRGDKSKAASLWTTYAALPDLADPLKERVLARTTAILIELSKRTEARLLLGKWIAWKDNAVARVRRSGLYLEDLQIGNSAADLAKAEELNPGLAELKELKPKVELASRYRNQIETETAAIEGKPNDANYLPWIMRARTLLLAGQPQAALMDLDVAAGKFGKPSAFFTIMRGMAMTRANRGIPPDLGVWRDDRWSSANAGFEEYIESNWTELLKVMAMDFTIAGVKQPAPQTWATRGWALWSMGQSSLALQDGESLASALPGNVDAQLLKLASMHSLGKNKEALDLADRLCAINRNSHGVHRFRAEILEALQSHEAAALAIDEAIRLSPESWLYWEIKANILTRLRRNDEAAQAARISTDLKKKSNR